MASDAQFLTFDASALVKLSTGEFCELEAVPSVVKVKGHIKAIPPVLPTSVQTSIAYAGIVWDGLGHERGRNEGGVELFGAA